MECRRKKMSEIIKITKTEWKTFWWNEDVDVFEWKPKRVAFEDMFTISRDENNQVDCMTTPCKIMDTTATDVCENCPGTFSKDSHHNIEDLHPNLELMNQREGKSDLIGCHRTNSDGVQGRIYGRST